MNTIFPTLSLVSAKTDFYLRRRPADLLATLVVVVSIRVRPPMVEYGTPHTRAKSYPP